MNLKLKQYSVLVIRVFLGLVFLISAIGKLIDSGYVNYSLVRLLSTKFYWMIEYATVLVISISVIELIIAVFLLWGKMLKWALSAALLLLLFFSGVMGYFYWQGMSVQACGCFGAFSIGGGLAFSLLKNLVLIIFVFLGLKLINSQMYQVQKISEQSPLD